MIETILSRVKEEVGIDGTKGTSIEKVWQYVETITKEILSQSGSTIVPVIDDKYKSFLWNYLKMEPELEFMLDKSPSTDNDQLVTEPALEIADTPEDQATPEESAAMIKFENDSPVTTPKRKAKPKPKAKPKQKKKRKARKAFPGADESEDEFVPEDDTEDSSEEDYVEDVSEESEEEESSIKKKKPVDLNMDIDNVRKSNPQKVTALSNNVKSEFEPIENARELTYEQLIQTYGDKLHVIASPELQEEQLLVGVPPGVVVSPNLRVVLKEIIRTRGTGLYQAAITKLLDLDSRSTGHYAKSLEDKGIIVRKGVSINSMHTNICVHTRYSKDKTQIDLTTVGEDEDDNEMPHNVNKHGKAYSQHDALVAMVELTRDAPNHVILSRDVLVSMGFDNANLRTRKWYNRTLNELCLKGYFSKSNARVNNTGKIFRSIHLLKIPEEMSTGTPLSITDGKEDQIQFPIILKSSKSDIQIEHMLIDTPLERQIYQVLEAAGLNGVTTRDLQFALNLNELRLLCKVMDKMDEVTQERYSIERYLEFEGRTRRYRYFTTAAYKKKFENSDIQFPPCTNSDLDESKAFERNIFVDLPHDFKTYKKYMDGIKKSGYHKDMVVPAPLPGPLRRGRPKNAKDTQPRKKKKTAGVVTTQNASANSSNGTDLTLVDTAGPSDDTAKKRGRKPKRVASSQDVDNTKTKKARSAPLPPLVITRGPTAVPITNGRGSNASIPIDLTDDPEPSTPANPVTAVEPTTNAPTKSNKKKITDFFRKKSTPATTTSAAEASEPEQTATEAPAVSETHTEENGKEMPTTDVSVMEEDNLVNTEKLDNAPIEPTESTVIEELKDVPMAEAETITAPVMNEQQDTIAENKQEATTAENEQQVTLIENKQEATSVENEQQVTIVEDNQEANAVENEQQLAVVENKQEVPTVESEQETTAVAIVQEANAAPDTQDVITLNPSQTEDQVSPSPGNHSISKHHHYKLQKNSYLETRIKVLLHMLEHQEPIVEIGKHLGIAYTKAAEELGFTAKSKICLKTIWRTAQEMTVRNIGQVDVIECPLLNGKLMTRKLLIRKDIDMQGVQYRNYVRYLRDRRAMQIVSYKFKPLETVEFSNIETLDQRINRMKDELNDLKARGDNKAAIELESRIEEMSDNLNTIHMANKGIGVSGSWMIKAIQFGFVNAVMLRTKLLHLLLLDQIQQDISGVDKENRVISLNTIILDMNLQQMCQIVGLFSYNEEEAAYVQNSENSLQLIRNLPPGVKRCIFSQHNKYRRRLYQMLSILEFLGIIKPLYTELYLPKEIKGKDYEFMAPEYKLLDTTVIRDYRRIGYPVFREYPLNDTSEAALYWSDLQYACTIGEESSLPEEEKAPEAEDPQLKKHIRTLFSRKSWSVRSVFTKPQRKLLNSYVDRTNHTTPLNNIPMLRQIAEALQLDMGDIKSYYEKVENALERKLQQSEYKRVERILTPRRRGNRGKQLEYYGKRVINLSSTRAFKRIRKPDHMIKNLPLSADVARDAAKENEAMSKQRSNGDALYLDDMGDIPVIQDDSDTLLQRQRVKRSNWSSQEDELLIYGIIILRQRANGGRMLWAAIRQLFPERNIAPCRHRFSKLMHNPVYVEQFETNARLWLQIYEEGIQSGELEDFDPIELVNFDLLGFVTFFIRKLTERNTKRNYLVFPTHIRALHDLYDISRSSSGQIYYFDQFHEFQTIVSKQQVLYSQSITLRRNEDTRFDQSESLIQKENEKNYRQCSLLKLFSLMCLLTPQELYDQFYCYLILQQFPKATLDKAVKQLIEENSVIKNKGARPIPGVKASLSAIFLDKLSGSLPNNMLHQAKEYENFLSTQDTKIRFNPTYVSSGMMACLLNLLSSNKLSVTFANMDSHLKKVNSSPFRGIRIDLSLFRFDLDIQKLNRGDHFMSYIPKLDEMYLKKMTEKEFDDALSDLVVNEDAFSAELLKKIVDLLFQEAQLGCTLFQLKENLSSIATDEDIIRALHKLCSNNPALVCRVGFEAVRYVHLAFMGDWSIESITTPDKNMKELFAQPSESFKINNNFEKKPFIVPSLWTDVNGNVTELLLKECKEAIVDIVVRRPGIAEADIQRLLKKALTRRETRDLLNILVEQQVLKRIQIALNPEPKKKMSIFSKTKQIKSVSVNIIEQTTQSCFWATPYTYIGIE